MIKNEQLLVNYLHENPLWLEMLDVFEKAYGGGARAFLDAVLTIRDFFQLEPVVSKRQAEAILANQPQTCFQLTDFKATDRKALIRSARLLGFSYADRDGRLLSVNDYIRILQGLGMYYRAQGTGAFLNFFSYCLNRKITLKQLWTEDYQNFYVSDNPIVGVPIWKGGTWYPTSHVQFSLLLTDLEMDPIAFRDLFNYLAPINLVLVATTYNAYAYGDVYLDVHARIHIIQK